MVVNDCNSAACVIQKYFRGFRVRKDLLEKVYIPCVSQLLQNPYAWVPMRRNMEGKTAVYFPCRFPEIVIKLSGSNCAIRLNQMVRGGHLCNKNGYTHLVIPKARIVDQCLVEERLPINTLPFEQAKIYLDHKEELIPLIQEFTHFAFQTGLTDMVEPRSPFFKGFDCPRVDNFPFFRNSEGKIVLGLIDLEHDKDNSHFTSSDLPIIYQKVICDLIYFFPYHAEIIKQIARQYLDEETILKLSLDEREEAGKQYLDAIGPHFLHYLEMRQKINEEIKGELIEELLHPTKLKCRRQIAKPSSFERQEIQSFVEGALQFLLDLKTQKKKDSSHLFEQCLLQFYLADFPVKPEGYQGIARRLLSSLERRKIIYHYCPKPIYGVGYEVVIF